MNTIYSTVFASLFALVGSVALADVTAPTPTIDTRWELAAIELAEPTLVASSNKVQLAAYQDHNQWVFRELIDSQTIEIRINELILETAVQLSKQALDSARDLAGI